MKAWSLNYWAARELSLRYFFNSISCFKSIIRLLILHFLTGDRVGILSIIQIWTSVIPFHANCWLSPLLPLKHLLLQVIKFLIKIHIIPCVVLVHLSSCPIWGEFWPDLDCASLFPSLGFPCGSADKESTCNVGDLGSIPGLGRSPGEGKGYSLQYSGMENSMDLVHGVSKSQTQLNDFHFSFLISLWTCQTIAFCIIPSSLACLIFP